MNMQQPDPGNLFEQFKGQAQNAPVNKSVMSQLASRPVPNQSLPPVSQPSPAPVNQPAAPADPVSQLVALSQSGEIKKLRALKEAQAQAADPVNQLVSMSQDGSLAKMRLDWEDRQYQEQLAEWERPGKIIPRPGTSYLQREDKGAKPESPTRSVDQISNDWQKGVYDVRDSEFENILKRIESGQLNPEQDKFISENIEPQLNPNGVKQFQIARLTRDDLEKLNAAAMAEEEQAKIFEKESLFMNPYQIAGDERFGQHTQSGNVFGRGVAKGLTMNYAFAPDEERLNSDDPAVVADERAKRLFYQQQEAKYPVSSLAGNILGAVPHFAVGGAALRGARVAKANLGLMAPTELTAEAIAANRAILASKGAATTTGGRVAMGAGEGLGYDLASRPEGSEEMDLMENLQARVTQAGFGVAMGSMMELGLLKAGDVWQLAKDKRFESQLKKEAKAQGYGSDVNRYMNDLLNTERYEDGRLFARPLRKPVTDLPDLESTHELSRAEQDRPDDALAIRAGSEPVNPTTGLHPSETAETTARPSGYTEDATRAEASAISSGEPDITPAGQPFERSGAGEATPVVPGGGEPSVSSPAAPISERVTTLRGTPVDVEFDLVDADELTTSHFSSGVVNPDYPAELQPRDRSRVGSEAQIWEIANNLRPDWLGRSAKASDGAPIIGEDNLVESGNGRVSAIRQAYVMGGGENYRQWLKDNAAQFGLNPSAIDGMNRPVLVRRRKTPMDDQQRSAFTREANESDIARMSATEQARTDASRLTDDDIMMFAPDESGNISVDSNRSFLRRFTERVGITDAGSMVDSQGRPNQAFVQRVQSAIFKKAYDDDRLLSLMAETTDSDLKGEAARNMVSALTRAAPAFARARSMGNLPSESDFVPNLLEAVDLVRKSRRENQSISELINQGSLLEPFEPVTEELARFFDANLRSSQRMGEVLKDLGQQLENEAARGGADLFGSAPASKTDFISATNRNMEAKGEQAPFSRNESTTQARTGSEATEVPPATETSRTEGQPAGAGRTAADDAGSGQAVSQVTELMGKKGGLPYHTEKAAKDAIKFQVNSKKLEGNISDYIAIEVEGGWKIAKTLPDSDIELNVRYPLEGYAINIDEPFSTAPIHIERSFRTQIEKQFPDEVTLHKKALKWARDHVENSGGEKYVATNNQTNQIIKMPVSGFDHTAERAKNDLIETLPFTKKMLENAKYRGWNKDYKGKRDVRRVHNYEIQVEIDGKVDNAWIRVLERTDGKYYYDTAFVRASDEGSSKATLSSTPGTLHLSNPEQWSRDEQVQVNKYSEKNNDLDIDKNTDNSLSHDKRVYVKSKEEGKVNTTEIKVETPDGTEKIAVTKNADGTITADGQQIPKGGEYVTNTHKGQTTEQANNNAGTLYSNPVNFAIRQMAQSLNLGQAAASSFGGGVYGATNSDEKIGSDQWWLDVMQGAGLATFGMGALRYNKLIGKDSFLANFSKYLGQQWEKLPGLGRGSPEIRRLKKQQQLMRQVINRQTGQMGEFLAKNFTPTERSEMADIIENRGYPKQANLVARQAQELDDFISYTAERMKELGMLSPDMETGGYLHRYYAKHLKLGMDGNLKDAFKQAKKQSLTGSYTIQRGTNETFQQEYLSDSVKQQMAEYDRIKTRIDELERTKDDLLFSQTSDELNELKEELKVMQEIQLKEYVGVQNGKPHAFIFMPDEVPKVPGLEPFAGSNVLPIQPEASDRIWSLRGTVGEQPVLWRDWTKSERDKWGEITDAGYRFVRGQAEVAHDLSMATMFHKISQRSDWVSDKPVTLDGEEWVEVSRSKIPKSQMYKYGALAGKYVKPDVWRALKHYNQPLFGRGRAATIYRNMLDKWKLYKTVYNPVSHFNNTVSNLQMYYMAGYSARHLGSSINELRKGENSQYWREARDVGLFGSDWSSSLLEGGEQSSNLAELAEVLRKQPDIADANQVNDSLSVINRFKTWLIESKESVNSSDTKLGSGAAVAKAIASPVVGVMNKPIKAATDGAKWLYQKEDELFKLAVFIEERKKGLKPFDAMEAANRFFFDYNDLPDAVRKVKDFPIGSPFISYTYLALPAIVRNAIERPERMLALAAAFEGLNYASLALDGQLEEQGYWDRMDAENAMNPPWMKGRAMWGALNTLDVSGFKPGLDTYKISLANAHAMGNPFAGESGKDLPLWPGFMAFWGPDPIGGNPVTRIPYDILFNVDWKGDKLYGENDKFEKSLKYAYQAIFPSMPLFPGSWHQKKVIEGMAGDVNKAREGGQPVNQLAESIVSAANSVSEALGGEQFTGADWRGNQFKTTDALSGSVGLKLRQYQPRDLYVMQVNKINRKINDERMSFNRKRRGDYTKAQMDKYKTEHRAELKRLGDEKKKLKIAYDSIK